MSDFLNAATEILSNPLVEGAVGVGVAIGVWKGASAILKWAKAENEREAKQDARLERARKIVTPIQFPPPRQ